MIEGGGQHAFGCVEFAVPVRGPREDVRRPAACVCLEVRECGGIEGPVGGVSPSGQRSGSVRLSRDGVEREKRAVGRAQRGTACGDEAKEGLVGRDRNGGQGNVGLQKQGECQHVSCPREGKDGKDREVPGFRSREDFMASGWDVGRGLSAGG